MPPRRAAAATGSRKRALPAAAAAAQPAARRKKAATAPGVEQATTTTLFEFDPRWAGPVKEMYKDRELHDVVLSAGDVSVAAHRVILAAASPHLRGLFREPRAGGGDGNGYCEESRTNRLYVTCADIASLPQFQGQ